MDDPEQRALKILEEFARLPRETGPVTLSPEYLEHIERVEALPQNQSGADKTARHRAESDFRNHYRRIQRPSLWRTSFCGWCANWDHAMCDA